MSKERPSLFGRIGKKVEGVVYQGVKEVPLPAVEVGALFFAALPHVLAYAMGYYAEEIAMLKRNSYQYYEELRAEVNNYLVETANEIYEREKRHKQDRAREEDPEGFLHAQEFVQEKLHKEYIEPLSSEEMLYSLEIYERYVLGVSSEDISSARSHLEILAKDASEHRWQKKLLGKYLGPEDLVTRFPAEINKTQSNGQDSFVKLLASGDGNCRSRVGLYIAFLAELASIDRDVGLLENVRVDEFSGGTDSFGKKYSGHVELSVKVDDSRVIPLKEYGADVRQEVGHRTQLRVDTYYLFLFAQALGMPSNNADYEDFLYKPEPFMQQPWNSFDVRTPLIAGVPSKEVQDPSSALEDLDRDIASRMEVLEWGVREKYTDEEVRAIVDGNPSKDLLLRYQRECQRAFLVDSADVKQEGSLGYLFDLRIKKDKETFEISEQDVLEHAANATIERSLQKERFEEYFAILATYPNKKEDVLRLQKLQARGDGALYLPAWLTRQDRERVLTLFSSWDGPQKNVLFSQDDLGFSGSNGDIFYFVPSVVDERLERYAHIKFAEFPLLLEAMQKLPEISDRMSLMHTGYYTVHSEQERFTLEDLRRYVTLLKQNEPKIIKEYRRQGKDYKRRAMLGEGFFVEEPFFPLDFLEEVASQEIPWAAQVENVTSGEVILRGDFSLTLRAPNEQINRGTIYLERARGEIDVDHADMNIVFGDESEDVRIHMNDARGRLAIAHRGNAPWGVLSFETWGVFGNVTLEGSLPKVIKIYFEGDAVASREFLQSIRALGKQVLREADSRGTFVRFVLVKKKDHDSLAYDLALLLLRGDGIFCEEDEEDEGGMAESVWWN